MVKTKNNKTVESDREGRLVVYPSLYSPAPKKNNHYEIDCPVDQQKIRLPGVSGSITLGSDLILD